MNMKVSPLPGSQRGTPFERTCFTWRSVVGAALMVAFTASVATCRNSSKRVSEHVHQQSSVSKRLFA